MNDKPTLTTVEAGGEKISAPRQYLTFSLAGEQFGIPILAVQEIRGWEACFRTPRSPGYVLGVMNLRGTIVPVLDLRALLGIEPCERTPLSVVIVVRVEGETAPITAGCLVDSVSDVVSLAADCGQRPPAACGPVDTHLLSGVAMIDQQLIMLIDVMRLIESSVKHPTEAIA
ncbi:MAG: chemotaxis protein CheW [Steroidobacteraceae bacterium]|jgi:purine-binding chemotaxis protein CheW